MNADWLQNMWVKVLLQAPPPHFDHAFRPSFDPFEPFEPSTFSPTFPQLSITVKRGGGLLLIHLSFSLCVFYCNFKMLRIDYMFPCSAQTHHIKITHHKRMIYYYY
jgi:hypothetical protein